MDDQIVDAVVVRSALPTAAKQLGTNVPVVTLVISTTEGNIDHVFAMYPQQAEEFARRLLEAATTDPPPDRPHLRLV